jgi:hypothetical protein
MGECINLEEAIEAAAQMSGAPHYDFGFWEFRKLKRLIFEKGFRFTRCYIYPENIPKTYPLNYRDQPLPVACINSMIISGGSITINSDNAKLSPYTCELVEICDRLNYKKKL